MMTMYHCSVCTVLRFEFAVTTDDGEAAALGLALARAPLAAIMLGDERTDEGAHRRALTSPRGVRSRSDSALTPSPGS